MRPQCGPHGSDGIPDPGDILPILAHIGFIDSGHGTSLSQDDLRQMVWLYDREHAADHGRYPDNLVGTRRRANPQQLGNRLRQTDPLGERLSLPELPAPSELRRP